MMSSRSRSRSAATILVAVLLPVALASAQGVRPVGDVKDHPVPPRASSDEAEALLDELNLDDVPQESMQSLFNWAIEHSDPERLREMAAEAAAAGGRGGDGAPRVPDAPLPDGDAASKVQPGRRHTEAELLAKREEVKQALDALASNPTEQQYIKQATEMYLDRTRGKADRLLALEELEDLVGPVDNANDLHVLGALVPLVRTAIDPTIDDDIGAAAASALGVAASNNHRRRRARANVSRRRRRKRKTAARWTPSPPRRTNHLPAIRAATPSRDSPRSRRTRRDPSRDVPNLCSRSR